MPFARFGRPLGVLAALLLLAPAPAGAQTTEPAYRPGGAVTDTNPQPVKLRCWTGAAWASCSPSVQESFQLASANAASAAVTAYGGDYILSQACTGYGTVALQVRGPDGATWLPLVTKTAADTNGGTGIALGSYAVVRVSLMGTAGCNAILSRVPA